MSEKHPDLVRIYNLFGLSSNHQLSTLLANIENAKRRSDMLSAVEQEFFQPAGNAPCLVNSWGSGTDSYLAQFREALKSIGPKESEQCGACAGCTNGCQLDKDSPEVRP